MLKTWEMLRELGENPLLKFKDNSGSAVGISDKTGRVVWLNGDREEVFIIYSHAPGRVDNLHLDWELVPQEIPWQEALEQWVKGKSVIRELNGTTCLFTKDNCFGVSRKELINRKWFLG